MKKDSILDLEWGEKRLKRKDYIYRLTRRTKEILHSIKEMFDRPIEVLVDIGTGDGLMLKRIIKEIDIFLPLGIDLSYELLKENLSEGLYFLQADGLNTP